MTKQPITHHFLTARERPSDLVAIRFRRHKSWLDLSWQEYFRRSEAAAVELDALGVEPGDRVAILANTRWEWAALDFAILGMGAVTVPVYQSSRPEEIEYVLNHCGARVLVAEDQAQLRKWEAIAKRCKTVEKVIVIQPAEDFKPTASLLAWDDFLSQGATKAASRPEFFMQRLRAAKLEDLATLVYTSGTTGEPKGVRLTHRQILAEVEAIGQAFPISTQDSTLSFLPYAHVMGRVELWLHTYIGFTLNIAESTDRLRQNLRDTKPTAIIGVPRIFEKIFAGIMTEIQGNPLRRGVFHWLEGGGLRWAKRALLNRLLFGKLREGLGGKLRFAVSGGAPLEPKIAEFFNDAGILVLEGYGLTETTAAITSNTPTAFRFGSVGRPLSHVEIKLADDGEILVKGDVVTPGYYKDSGDGDKSFNGGYFHTGDIGEWTSDGFLRITDRKKDLIKTSGGKYVAPQKLEGLLKLDPLISNALIHGDRKKYVVALLTLDEVAARNMARHNGWVFRDYKSLTQSPQMREYVRKIVAQANTQLASFETIKSFAILPNDFTIEGGELTPSLKVKRRVADERYRDVIESLY